MTQSTVNNIVSGRNRSATISTIKKLCDGFGITIQDFFESEPFYDLEQKIKQLQEHFRFQYALNHPTQ